MVFIDRAPPELPCWLISSDDHEIGRLAARHLIEAGAKTLACVGSPFPNLQERIKGFREEANNLGVAIPSGRMPSCEGNRGGEKPIHHVAPDGTASPAGRHLLFQRSIRVGRPPASP